MITKAAYNEVAAAIREAKTECLDTIDRDGVELVEGRVADRFAKDNPRFDRELFCLACNPDAQTSSKE